MLTTYRIQQFNVKHTDNPFTIVWEGKADGVLLGITKPSWVRHGEDDITIICFETLESLKFELTKSDNGNIYLNILKEAVPCSP